MEDILITSSPWYTNTALLVGVVAFIATVTGALIGALTQVLIAREQARRDDAREARKDAIEAKRAARLVADDLSCAYAILQVNIDRKQWSAIRASLDNWNQYRHVLAVALNATDFKNVTDAVLHVTQMVLAGTMAERGQPPIISDASIEFLATNASTVIQNGLKSLAVLYGD
jgi:hypothetical protein